MLLSQVAMSQADITPYTVLPQPIEVNSFPYVEEGFDSDAVASGTPMGMQGICHTLPCCSGVWYKVTINTRGSLYAGFDKYLALSASLIWYKADSENITTTDQLTYLQSPNNFCGFRGQAASDYGYAWVSKYGSPEQIAEDLADPDPSRSLVNIGFNPATIPDDLSAYPADGWSFDGIESIPRFVEPGTYWLYAWNTNSQVYAGNGQLNGPEELGDHKLIIDFAEFCPEGFDCFEEAVSICTEESFTTPGGQVITETSSYEETIGNVITTYRVTLDESIQCCPEGVTCTDQAATICTAEVFTTPNGTQYSEAGQYVEEIDAATRINWTITEDPSVNCCPQGFTCNTIDVTECANLVYTSPLGNTLTEDGTVIDVDNTNNIRNTYNVTFQRTEPTVDVFQNAIIAESGSVSYRANTNATGVLSFDKSEDHYVDLDALQNDLDGTNRSVFMWIKSEANVTSRAQVLFGINYGASTSFPVASLYIDPSGDVLKLNASGSFRSTSTSMNGEVWNYVGYTYNATTLETSVYINGRLATSFTRSQPTDATSRYSLGQEFINSNTTDDFHYNGEMAEVSVWNEVLSASDIRQAMQQKIDNSHPKFANLKGYYSVFGACDDDTAVLKDHSGNNNDGIMRNGFTQAFENVQSIPGFNAAGWYDKFSWKKDGAEISTAVTLITEVAAGNYEFTATRNFVQSTDTWSMTLNGNTAMVDSFADERVCEDGSVSKTITDVNGVNYMDFEETEDNYVELNALTDDVAGKSRSVFMWYNKESSISSGNFDEILVFQDPSLSELSRFYIRSTERLAIWAGGSNRLDSSPLTNGVWYYIGYTYDHSTGETKLYLDGKLEDSGTFDMPLGDGWITTLGAKFNSSGDEDHTDAKIAEVTIWDKVLSEEEINSLMVTAPAHDADNLVAAYGTLPGISDNVLRDLTANGNDGLLSHNTILIDTEEIVFEGYDASANYTFSWKKGGSEFDTDATGNITVEEGTTAYSVTYGTPLFQKTDDFSLSYTNLLPTQPEPASVIVNGNVTFEVEEVAGATYQWYSRQAGELLSIEAGENGFPASPGIYLHIRTDNGKIYIATRAGLVISADGGLNWTTITSDSGFPNNTLTALEVDGDNIYIGTQNEGFSVSNDGGQTWTTTKANENGFPFSNNPADVEKEGNVIYVATEKGLAISTDGASTWNVIGKGTPGFSQSGDLQDAFVVGDKIYLASETRGSDLGGVSISLDGGTTWSTTNLGDAGFSNGTDVWSVYASGNNVYAGTNAGLSISRDGGQTWTTDTSLFGTFADIRGIHGEGNTLVAGTVNGGAFASEDNGQTWSPVGPTITALSVHKTNELLITGSNSTSGFIQTNRSALEDESDETAANQIQGATTHRLTINNLNLDLNGVDYFVVVSKDGCFTESDDVKLTVIQAPVLASFTPTSRSTDVALNTGFTLNYEAEIQSGTGLLRVFDYDTEIEVGSAAVTVSGNGASIAEGSFTLGYGTKYYVVLDADLVQDSGGNSSEAVTDKDYWTFTTECEQLVFGHPEDQNTDTGGSVSFSVPEVTGATYQWFSKLQLWNTVTRRQNGFGSESDIRTVFADDNRIFAGTRGGLSISEDGGESWTTIIGGQNGFATSSTINDIYAEGNTIYAATDGGLSISEDGGSTWTTYTTEDGFNDNEVLSVFVFNNDLYVGTDDGFSILESGSTTWETTTRLKTSFGSSSRAFDPVSMVVTDHAFYFVASRALYFDTGATYWSRDLEFDFTFITESDGTLYAGTQGSGLIYRKENETSWNVIDVAQGTGLPSNYVYAIDVFEGTIYAATSAGLAVREAGTTDWITIDSNDNGFASDYIRDVIRVRDNVVVGTSDGLSISQESPVLENSPNGTTENQIVGSNTRELTINNITGELNQTQYFVVVTKGNCEEFSNNALLTVQIAPPAVTAFSPADDAVDHSRFNNPAITFDKAIGKGTGNIEIRRSSDDQLLTNIDASSVLVTINDKTASLKLGNSNFDFSTEYYINIPEGAFTSIDGGVYGGINDKTEWNFTIVDAPAMVSTNPMDDATDVDEGINEAGIENAFSFVFNQDMEFGIGGSFDLYKSEGDELIGKTINSSLTNFSIQIADDNRTVQLFFVDPDTNAFDPTQAAPIVLEPGTEYYILTSNIPFFDFSITDKTEWNFTTASTGLMVSSLSPEDDATRLQPEALNAGLPAVGNFRITFDQAIAYNNTDAAFELYTAADDQLVARQTLASTISGPAVGDFNSLGFSFASYNFQLDTEYYILVDAGMVKSQESGLPFAGISDKTTWSFKTAGQPFAWEAAEPSANSDNGGVDVPVKMSDFQFAYFTGHLTYIGDVSEGFTPNNEGKIGLYTAADDQLVYELDLAEETIVTDPEGEGRLGKINMFHFADAYLLLINDDFIMNGNTQYYWLVDEGVAISPDGGRSKAINDKTTWTFTTEAIQTEILPVQSFAPVTDSPLDLGFDGITLRFAEETEIAAGTGNLTIYKGSDDSVFEVLSISDFNVRNSGRPNTASANVTNAYELGETYYVNYPEGFIKSLDGTKSVAAVTDKTTWSYGTGPLADAIFESFYPAPGSSNYDASKGSDFDIFFSENVTQDELEPVGAIKIYKASDNSLFKTIEFDGENDRDLDYPGEDNEINLEFNRNELEPDTEYYVLIDDGFVVSYDGPRYHKGISDPNTWRFRTAALPTEPVLVNSNPATATSDISVTTNLVLTFSENVVPGFFGEMQLPTHVVLYDAADMEVERFATNMLNISGGTVTIDPSADLSPMQTYYVLIDEGAFKSNVGEDFAGITDVNALRFTTGAAPNTAPVASAQDFSGNLEVRQQLTGTYTYTDADTDPETNSVYQWYMADDAGGSNAAPVTGANAQNFTLTGAEEGKFLALAITPFDGEDAGAEVFTDYKGPIVPAVIPTLVSTSPVDGAEGVATDASLVFTFSEPVTKGAGRIAYFTLSGNGVTIGVESDDVAINGATVTLVTSPFGLEAGEFYTVTFEAAAFVDADGNASEGLTSETRWNFTTEKVNAVPEASGVTINQSQVVDGELEGSYTYSDDDGDAEEGTTYLWFRADDADGTNKTPIFGVATQNYTATNADDGKFLSFLVTPGDGNGFGEASESALLGPIVVNTGSNNIAPAFTSNALTSVLDNETYTYKITFEDINNDTPVLTKTIGPDWLSVSGFELTGAPTVADIGEYDLVLTLDDQNGGTATQTFTVTVEPSNIAPTVVGIEVTGTTTIDETLTGTYNFLDDDGDNDNSSFQWYRSDDAQGANKAAIGGATGTTYKLAAADAGKFISFEVTPNDGTVDGNAAGSAPQGAVAKKVPTLTLTAIAKVYGDVDFDLAATTNSTGAVTYAFDNDMTGANLNGATVSLGTPGTINVDVTLAETADFQGRTIHSSITVSPKVVQFTANDASKLVAEADPELTFSITSGAVIGGDEVVTIGRDAGETAGTYNISFSEGADAANYEISTVGATFSITQTALTITADAATKTYGEVDPEFTFTITEGELAAGDELNGIISREEGEDVGTYALESSLFNAKYDITFIPANLTIGKADLSISVDDQSRNFGEANPAFTLSFDGLTNGDEASDFDTAPVASTTATEASAPGSYDITLNTPADANYNITGTTKGILTVDASNIALSIADVTANEDDGDITVTVVLDNAVGGGFTVDASTADGTATVGADYTAVSSQTLTFAGTAGEEQSFTITPSADFTQEQNETLTISLSNLAGTVLPIDITDEATVTIANDDVDADLFIITFETTSDNEAVNLPTQGGGYNYGIDWGDGTIDFGVTGDKEHSYAVAGTYKVRITGDFPRIYFKGDESDASDDNALKIKSIEQWGTNTWVSMNGAFEGAMNMVLNATDVPDLSAVFSMEEMFSDCDGLTNNDFTAWDVSKVTNMKEMFERADNFNGNISNWDVSNVTNMEQMFKNAISFNGDITGWNTGKVVNMSEMFRKSSSAPSGTEMSFNQNIDSWDVGSVTDFGRMFDDNSVFNQDLNSWDVSSAEDMSFMFRRTDVFNGNISNWDVSSVTEMQNMFGNALVFNQDISGWDVSAVERMDEMFDGAAQFNANIRNWDVSSVENMEQMFEDTENFNADISIWQTSSLTNMEGMFLRAKVFNQDISGWDISGITSLDQTFEEADAFNQDLSGWNTGSITVMTSLFQGADAFNQDISGWNVSAVTNMDSLLFNATAFDQSLANWNIGVVTEMGDMLSGSGLSVANYDVTLTGWAGQTVQNGVTLGAKGLEYCASSADRQSLIDNENWTFDGDAQGCETVLTFTETGGVEDDGDIVVTVTSSNAIIGGFTVDVNTADGTATAGSDYTAITSETLTFAGTAGEEQSFIVTPTADSDDEPNESITVSMDNLVVGAGNTVDITDQGTVTIFNEDVAEAFFTTIWETTADNQSITIPTEGEGYNYRIDWGDGTIEKNQMGDATHAYATAGAYTVKIVGSFPRIVFGNLRSSISSLFKSVEQWGAIEWASMENAFRGLSSFSINAPGAPDLSKVTSMRFAFASSTSFNEDISGWDVSNVTDMLGMFNSASAFNQDISGWNVSNVTNMASMFNGAKAFNQPLDDWNVGNVTTMQSMFTNADAFNQDLNSWDVSKVELFDHMFKQTDVFNGNISSWNVSSGTDFEEMFQEADAFNQAIGNWDLASATNVRRMFQETEVFNQSLNNWRFPNLTNTEQMFRRSKAFNQDLNDWEMGNIIAVDDMFEEAEAFNGNISNWDVSNVKDFSFAFDEAENFNQDISSWDVSKGENFRNMFDEATNFNQDLSGWEVSNGTNFSRMFNSATNFDQDLSGWDVTNATNMGSMFNNSGLSIENYDALLTAWAKQDVNSGIELGVTGLQFCAGSNGRQTLIDIKGWTIENDGVNCITTVTIEDVMAAEDGGDITVTLMSSNFVAEGFTVDVTTADGTATAGEDYTAVTSETITFFGAAGETQAFTITPNADINEEADETLTVSMDNVVTGANNTVTATDIGTVTIQNDDAAAFTFTLNTQFRINQEITVFRVKEGLTYDYNIDWGDGTIETGQTGNGVHTYASAGPFTVKITGDFPGFEMDYFGLETVEQWGDQVWGNLENAFFRRTLTINATDVPNLTAGPSLAGMFSSTNLGTPDLTGWDVSAITNMSGLFNSSDFDGNVSNWDVSNVTDMSSMFSSSPFNGDLSIWNTGKVTTMRAMFASNSAFNGDISNWDVSKVTNTESMFNNADAFNTDISSWNMSAVTDMTSMFAETDLFNQNISSWDVSNVEDMAAMFSGSKAFNQPLDDWDVSNVTTMELMFRNADAFNQDLNSWDVSKVEKFDEMFKQTALFNGDITGWDVSAGQDFEEMFQETEAFNQPIGNWDLSSATLVRRMFRDAELFNQPINDWRFPMLESLEQMFWGALVFNQDLNDWDVSNITDMASTFEEAESFNGNISNWNVSKVEDFDEFMNATPFNQDISGWDVSSATDFGRMFEDSPNFNQDLSGWDMSKATDVAYMFEGATSFNQDISSWQLTSVTSFDAMLKLSGMSIANYDAFLIALAQQDVQDEVYFDAEGLQFCAGKAARQMLIDNQNWTFENDTQSCSATVTIADVSGNEDDGDITVTLTSDAFVVDGFTVDVSTADGTATAGTDYNAVTSQTITFAGTAGETQTFTITPSADTDVEGNETLTVSMSNMVTGTDNTVIITDQATVTIVGDDQPVVSFASTAASNSESFTSSAIEVTLDQTGLSTITVDYTVAGTATGDGTDHSLANGTLSFAAGDASENINLSIIDDDLIEADETVIITLSNASGASIGTNGTFTYTIENNDARVTIEDVSQVEDGEAFLLTASLEGNIAGGFTVDVVTADGTAMVADSDYTALAGETLTFAGTDGETQTFDIEPGVDTKLEANETFAVSMNNLAGTSADVVITDQATLTITNDDAAAITIADASGNEGDGPITLIASLNNAVQGGFTVEVSTADGTATIADSDYTALAGQTLTFVGTAGETQTFTVTPTNDLNIEADETLTMSLSNLSTALAVDISDDATVTINNDDFNNAPTDITLSATSIEENGALDATIGSLSTTDADAGDTHTYSLVAGTGDADNGFFVLDGADLKANNLSFNFEFQPSYSIRLQTDDGNGGVFAKAMTISITDVNEAPFQISLSNNMITESDEAQDVGMLMSLDPDAGETFTYTFVEGEQDAHNAQFEIVGNTVRTAGAINFEEGASRDFRVRVTDSGGLTFEWAFTVLIEDVTEEPVRDFSTNEPGGDVKNIFSPNGDGVNETWVIEDLQDNPVNEVRVFAQGGKLLYSQVNYQNDWDGTFKGDPIPDGTYYFEIIIFESSQSAEPAKIIKGFLTIIRSR